jgi:poly(hydroxyalkanoate) granule-associated protein
MATTNGGNVSDKAREIWLAGLGAFSMIEEEGEVLFNKMKEEGQKLEGKGQDLFTKMKEKGQELEGKGEEFEKKAKAKFDEMPNPLKYVEGAMNTAFDKFGVASHKEMHELTEKVDKLTEIVAVLAKKLDSKPAAPKKG